MRAEEENEFDYVGFSADRPGHGDSGGSIRQPLAFMGEPEAAGSGRLNMSLLMGGRENILNGPLFADDGALGLGYVGQQPQRPGSGGAAGAGGGGAAAVPLSALEPPAEALSLNQTLLIPNEMDYRGEAFRERMIGLDLSKFIPQLIIAFFALPLYAMWDAFQSRRSSPPRRYVEGEEYDAEPPSLLWAVACCLVSCGYYAVLLACVVLFFRTRPEHMQTAEIVLLLALHGACMFVLVLLPCLQWGSTASFNKEAAAWLSTRVFVDDYVDQDTYEVGPTQAKPSARPLPEPRSTRLLIRHIVRSGAVASEGALRHESRGDRMGQKMIALACAFLYALIPELTRKLNGSYDVKHPRSFYWLAALSALANFLLSFVVFDTLGLNIASLARRWHCATAFHRITSESGALASKSYCLRLNRADNLWGWRFIRSYLLHIGRRSQQRAEVILSVALLFLLPVGLIIAYEILFTKNPVTPFTASGMFLVLVMSLFFIVCVMGGVAVQDMFMDTDVLLKEQLDNHRLLCEPLPPKDHPSRETRDARDQELSRLNAAISKLIAVIDKAQGKGVVLRVLGIPIDTSFRNTLIALTVSIGSASFGKFVARALQCMMIMML